MAVFACDVGGSYGAHLTREQKLNPPKVDWYGQSIPVTLLRMPTVLGVKELRILDQINPGWNKKRKLRTHSSGAVMESGA